jgi:hypothetical protein
MADQCIVCLDNLDVQAAPISPQLPPPEFPINTQSKPNPTIAEGAVSPSSIHTDDASGDKSTSASTNTNTSASTTNSDNDTTTTATASGLPRIDDDKKIAVIQICGHTLHDSCLREWTGKANSCPICRQAFHLVHVYDKVGGK